MAERTERVSPDHETLVVDEGDAGNISMLRNANPASASAGSPPPPKASTPAISDDTPPAAPQGPHITNKPPVATRACLSCRKLKMKCVGSADPPCERCIKTERTCEFLQPGQTHPAQARRRKAPPPPPQQASLSFDARDQRPGESSSAGVNGSRLGEHTRVSYSAPSWTPVMLDEAAAKKRSPLPSGSGRAGTGKVNGEGGNAVVQQQPTFKRRRTGGRLADALDGGEEGLSEMDMEQLLELFQERVLRFIPILGPEDFDGIRIMLRERKALVQCVCYVTASFLPGGSAIRDKLYRPVSEILLSIPDTQTLQQTQSLTLMQALIVLYAYAQGVRTTNEHSSSAPQDLLYWHIKTFTEAQATRIFLHRSIEGLRAAVASQERNISASYSYKMYTYWLWLYTMSHYGSQVTRTPPSIRADASIRAASKLLNEIGLNSRVADLLNQVEICLIWERANGYEQCGEWWCQSEPETQGESTNQQIAEQSQESLNLLAGALNLKVALSDIGGFQGSNLDFHSRFTRFCISTYTLRHIKLNAEGSDGLSPAEKKAILKSVETASQLLAWALDLGPVSKDRLRYFGDFGFAMLSFCAFYIIQLVQAVGPVIPQSDDFLDTVEDAAQLMTELAMDSRHAPAVYGKSIFLLLAKIRDPAANQVGNETLALESAVSNTRSRLGIQASVGRESQTWDFASLFPDLLWN